MTGWPSGKGHVPPFRGLHKGTRCKDFVGILPPGFLHGLGSGGGGGGDSSAGVNMKPGRYRVHDWIRQQGHFQGRYPHPYWSERRTASGARGGGSTEGRRRRPGRERI